MLKMACVKDAELFYMLENHGRVFVEDKFQASLTSLPSCIERIPLLAFTRISGIAGRRLRLIDLNISEGCSFLANNSYFTSVQ